MPLSCETKPNNSLKREAGLFSASCLIIANMIGTGVFTTTGFIMGDLKDPVLLLWAWIIGGLFALAGAFCYAELGSYFPKAGGEYVYIRKTLGPLAGFLSGWVSLVVGFTAPIAASSMAFSAYLLQAMPCLSFDELKIGLGNFDLMVISPAGFIAVLLIVGLSYLHSRSVSKGIHFQNCMTIFKIVLIFFFIFACFRALDSNSINNLEWANRHTPNKASFFSSEFAVALIFVSFAYSGWNASTYLGQEIKNPLRNIPYSLILGTLIVMGIYIVLNLIFVLAIPCGEMSGVLEIGAKAARLLLGERIGELFSAGIAFCLLSNVGAMIITGPRVYFAMANDGLFFKSFKKVDHSGKTPKKAVIFQAGLAVFMVLTASFSWLLIYIGFTLSLFTSLAVISLILIRYKNKDKKVKSHYRTPFFPFIPFVFIAGNLWIVCYTVKSNIYACGAALVTILSGCLVYGLFKNKLGTKTQKIGNPSKIIGN